MKVLAIGDPHGRTHWEQFIGYESDYDYIVFIGDYVHSYNISAETQLNNLRQIIEFKQRNNNVILLLGNHDLNCIDPVTFQCSGFNAHINFVAAHLFEEHKNLFQMATEIDDILYTHAGVSNTWLNLHNEHINHLPIPEQVNQLWLNKPQSFSWNGKNEYGDDKTQGPTWIRHRSLLSDSAHPKQIVGHTQLDVPHTYTSNGNQVTIIDSPKYYTIIDNGNITHHKYEIFQKRR